MQNEEKTKENQKEIRSDGYKNLLNKYGTKNDASEHYAFESDGIISDVDLEINYEENGLFAKIIDIPADDAVRGGCNYNISDVDITTFIDKSLDELDFKAKAAEALKWARLFGGSIMVMLLTMQESLTILSIGIIFRELMNCRFLNCPLLLLTITAFTEQAE